MKTLITYLGSGSLYNYPNQKAVALTVVDLSDITKKIIPFFYKNPILGVKQLDFLPYGDWCKVADLMASGTHLTSEGLDFIRTIKSGMNKNR